MRLTRTIIVAGLLLMPMGVAAQEFSPENPQCLAGANPGGGWDFICRQTARVMSDLDLFDGTMQVTDMSGGGGGVAYAHLVNAREGQNIIMASSSGITTRLSQNAFPGNTMDDVNWLGAIGTE